MECAFRGDSMSSKEQAESVQLPEQEKDVAASTENGQKTGSPLESLLEVSRMLSRALDIGEVLPRAMRVTENVLNAEAASLLLRDEESGKLRFHVAHGEHTDSLESVELEKGEGIAGWVMEHGEPQLISDAYEDPRFDQEVDKRTGFKTRSIICVPLQVGNRCIGVLQVLNRRDGGPFSKEDLALLGSVAAIVGLVIENAREHRLRVEAERSAVMGKTISCVGQCVRNSLQGLQSGSYLIDKSMEEIHNGFLIRSWKMVKRNIHLLSDLVMDMLSYAKDRPLAKVPTDLNALCQDVCWTFQPKARKQGMNLSLKLDKNIGMLKVDATGIRRCLNNLIWILADNAIKQVNCFLFQTLPKMAYNAKIDKANNIILQD